ELRELWLIESYDAADKALNILLARFLAKCYPAEIKEAEKKRGERLAFYSFLSIRRTGHQIRRRIRLNQLL
ncbi:MAG: hypothetical protein ACTS8W_02550, partial [Arsenophonus sp. NC-PY1-MAG3]